MTKVVVIMRELPGCEKVVSKVVKVPDDIDFEESFAQSEVDSHSKTFCEQFVEFKNAKWTSSIHPMSNY